MQLVGLIQNVAWCLRGHGIKFEIGTLLNQYISVILLGGQCTGLISSHTPAISGLKMSNSSVEHGVGLPSSIGVFYTIQKSPKAQPHMGLAYIAST